MQNYLFKNRTTQYERLLKEIAEKHKVDDSLLKELIDYEQGRVHLKRRRGAKKDIRHQIDAHLTEENR